MVSKESGGVPAIDKRRLQHSLLIPAIPPSCYSLCRIIHIMYALEVKLSVPGIHKSDKLRIPITIGTVPLTPANIFGLHSMFVTNEETNFVNQSPQTSQVPSAIPLTAVGGLESNVIEMNPIGPPPYSELPIPGIESSRFSSKLTVSKCLEI